MTPFGLRFDRFEIGVRNRVHPLFDFPRPGFEQAKVCGGQRIGLGGCGPRRKACARRQCEKCQADEQNDRQRMPHARLPRKPWVRIASSALSASSLFPFSKLLAESTLEAMRTQG